MSVPSFVFLILLGVFCPLSYSKVRQVWSATQCLFEQDTHKALSLPACPEALAAACDPGKPPRSNTGDRWPGQVMSW